MQLLATRAAPAARRGPEEVRSLAVQGTFDTGVVEAQPLEDLHTLDLWACGLLEDILEGVWQFLESTLLAESRSSRVQELYESHQELGVVRPVHWPSDSRRVQRLDGPAEIMGVKRALRDILTDSDSAGQSNSLRNDHLAHLFADVQREDEEQAAAAAAAAGAAEAAEAAVAEATAETPVSGDESGSAATATVTGVAAAKKASSFWARFTRKKRQARQDQAKGGQGMDGGASLPGSSSSSSSSLASVSGEGAAGGVTLPQLILEPVRDISASVSAADGTTEQSAEVLDTGRSKGSGGTPLRRHRRGHGHGSRRTPRRSPRERSTPRRGPRKSPRDDP